MIQELRWDFGNKMFVMNLTMKVYKDSLKMIKKKLRQNGNQIIIKLQA